MEKIKDIKAIKILNSRSEETIKVTAISDNFRASFSVPQGKSKGKYEAIFLPPDESIKKILGLLLPNIRNKEVNFQEIDKFLINQDGTSQKRVLGANSILGVSVAVAKLQAKIERKPLFNFLSQFFKNPRPKKPRLLMNLVNGGVHSFGGPAIQEYLILVNGTDFKESVFLGSEIYKRLGEILNENIGDEGGYVIRNGDAEEPLRILKEVIEKQSAKDKIAFGLDVAASYFFDGKNYKIDGKDLSKDEISNFYSSLFSKYNIQYLEDPFEEDDFGAFAELKTRTQNCLIVGDDLTVTNKKKIKEAVDKNSISGVIIKPNQIGSLTETIEAVNLAIENNIEVIISHRSGETNDSFISDLAVACGAWGIKTGAPARGERVAKYNRLIEIELMSSLLKKN